MYKYMICKYINPKGNICYCLNGGQGQTVEYIKKFWHDYERPQGYILIDILTIDEKEFNIVDNWQKCHARWSIRVNKANKIFFNTVTNGQFENFIEG